MPNTRFSLKHALLAGAIAIVANTVLLHLADLIALQTARGGLLKLLGVLFADGLRGSGIASLWHALSGPPPSAGSFKVAFHLFVGLLMALFYASRAGAVHPGLALAQECCLCRRRLAGKRLHRAALDRRRHRRSPLSDVRRDGLLRLRAHGLFSAARGALRALAQIGSGAFVVEDCARCGQRMRQKNGYARRLQESE